MALISIAKNLTYSLVENKCFTPATDMVAMLGPSNSAEKPQLCACGFFLLNLEISQLFDRFKLLWISSGVASLWELYPDMEGSRGPSKLAVLTAVESPLNLPKLGSCGWKTCTIYFRVVQLQYG